MTNIREAFLARLTGNAPLAALAVGGIWDFDSIVAADYKPDGFTLEVMAEENSSSPRAAIYVKWSSESVIYPQKAHGKRLIAEVYFYDYLGYDTIQEMGTQVYELLHEYKDLSFDTPANWYCLEIVFSGKLTNMKDEALAGACFERARYELRTIEDISRRL